MAVLNPDNERVDAAQYRVDTIQLLDAAFRILALGDVGADAGDARRLARGGGDEERPRQDPAQRAVRTRDEELEPAVA